MIWPPYERRREILGSQDRIALFQNYAEEIRFLKRQQWTVTNYSALIYAAIIAYYEYLREVSCVSWEKYPLLFIAVLTAIIGTIILFKIQSDLVKNRERIEEIKKFYPFNEKILGKSSENETSYWYQFIFLVLFGWVLYGGASLVGYYLFR